MKPHRVIGPVDNPYMYRWHVLRIGKLPRIYVHRFIRSDDDRALHNHPWWFISILLTGSYIEHTRLGPINRHAGSVAFRGLQHDHRIELIPGKTVRTLFITGPVVRRWGFWCIQRDTEGKAVAEYFVPASQFDGCS